MARQQTYSFSFGPSLMQRMRTLADLALRRFGIHCATHQVRLILISAIVITSLSYPALAIYWSTPAYSRFVSTSNPLDSFLTAHATYDSYTQRDIHQLWDGNANLQVRDDFLTRARCGSDRTLRVERILVNTVDGAGALSLQTLLYTLQLEGRILQGLLNHGVSCNDLNSHHCFVISPLSFWEHDEERLRSDRNISLTATRSEGVTAAGVHVTPQMVLTGRDSSQRNPATPDSAMFLALTYVFPETDCSRSAGHDSWLQIIENSTMEIAESARVFTVTAEPKLIALEYNHSLSKTTGTSSISTFLYLSYGAFCAYVSWSMKRMNGVHTRIGLTFTALVEIAASTITSLSVCALLRFKVTMVPWSLLPIVIIFVGAENMFNLVDAVTRTSITLPVKERIAEGLSRAGTSNTLKVLSYNSILGVIAFFSAGAIRQFCTFAVVVLIAHWFLAHTFFLAVLSIDIQRLELNQLLRQDPSLTPAASASTRDASLEKNAPNWQRATLNAKESLKGRALTNISLLLLLAITATLYVMTRPAARESEAGFIIPSTVQQRTQAAHRRPDSQDPAWRIWKTLNPHEEPLVHLRLEVPAIVAFQPGTGAELGYEHAPGPARSINLVFWFLKFVILPIGVTIATLYGLLLYLLKDAELLEAQRNRAEADAPSLKGEKSLNGETSFKTLPRAFATDVELLASSKDCEVIAAVGLQNELSIWHFNDPNPVLIDTSDILLSTGSTSFSQERIAAVALDDAGEYCAIGTTHGTIGVWFMPGRSARLYTTLAPHSIAAGIRELHFAPPLQSVLKQKNGPQSRPCTPPPGPPEPEPLVVVYEDGAIAQWVMDGHSSASFISPMSSEPILQSRLLRVRSDDRILAAFVLADGALELFGVCEARSSVPIRCALQPGNSVDRVSKIDACKVRLDGRDHIIIGVASEVGVISLWDAGSSECIFILEENHGAIDQLRISNSRVVNCQFCGEPPMDSFMVSVSIGHDVIFHKVYITSQGRRCTCPRNNPQESTILELATGRRSRSSSTASTIGPSSVPSTRRLSSASTASAPDTSAFPVSGHGILSRRASEKGLRRLSESYVLAHLTDEDDEGHSIHIDPPIASRPSTWSNVAVIRAGEAACERGGWDISGEKIIGVRRISRAHTKGSLQLSSTSRGLTPAVLDRWEIWLFDTGVSKARSATLSSLTDDPPLSLRRSFLPSMYLSRPPSPTAVPEEYPRIPFTRVSPFLAIRGAAMAGFGNTVGLFLVS
ncbi:sterol-sensing domain of SREBP cleavage-activation-domain-containing protein [Suillus clintonianus]|uniref:sterol-sensing domain of SREBP cleavage-activation-domain-containing protein n=1 Tax=Suillus clintonianus TaxID=1904413 RepID=UPI001B8641A3|nr:sterol-sensing domain of SREBP cleavage-activation-domain-containing protein [Suillus clintonianus]KAG2120036.1 sterol-sensing domain of SREBP cleavage-activation-domain-containing protein [Suillus clintonianus]